MSNPLFSALGGNNNIMSMLQRLKSRTPLYTEALSENYKNSETKHLQSQVLFKYILKIG